MVQWLRFHTPDTGDPGSIPGQGNKSHKLQLKIPYAATIWAPLIAQSVKNLPATQETLVRFLGREDLLEKG